MLCVLHDVYASYCSNHAWSCIAAVGLPFCCCSWLLLLLGCSNHAWFFYIKFGLLLLLCSLLFFLGCSNHAWFRHTANWLASVAVLAVPLSWPQLLKELLAHTTQAVAYSKETMTLCSLNRHDNIRDDLIGRAWAIGDMLVPGLREQLEKVKEVYEKWVELQLSPEEGRFAKRIAAAAAEAVPVPGAQGDHEAYEVMEKVYERVMQFGVKVPYSALPKIFE